MKKIAMSAVAACLIFASTNFVAGQNMIENEAALSPYEVEFSTTWWKKDKKPKTIEQQETPAPTESVVPTPAPKETPPPETPNDPNESSLVCC